MTVKAVVFAPNIDDNLGKACAERAACLLRLGDYKRALVDIEQVKIHVDFRVLGWAMASIRQYIGSHDNK